MLTGIDARLIEAEAKIATSDFTGMLAILNTLRTSPQQIGSKTIPAMAALTTVPTTMDAAVTLFFREKAFWAVRSRLPTRPCVELIRQYGLLAGRRLSRWRVVQGRYSYGTDVNLPMNDTELTNPNLRDAWTGAHEIR